MIEFKAVSKKFGSIEANRNMSFRVEPGSIHAIVGENGAGKSTAMKMLYGMLQPDSGEIMVRGNVVRYRSSIEAIEDRIGMVHQHFMLSLPQTALDNVILGAEPVSSASLKCLPRFLHKIDRASARTRLEAISTSQSMHVPWEKPVSELSVGIQQRIEIIKLLFREAEILILDEPTAVLTPPEVVELFHALRRLKNQGKTILIITHKLKEVMALSDSVTVLRRGEVVKTLKTPESSVEELGSLMVGRQVNSQIHPEDVPKLGEVLLSVRGVILKQTSENAVNFEVRSGEILGVAGVEGNGQTELLELITGRARRAPGADIRYTSSCNTGVGSERKLSARSFRSLRVAYIPEDRHRQGILLDQSALENFMLGQHHDPDFQKWGVFRRRNAKMKLQTSMERFDVRPRNAELLAKGFSGGNQQKLVIAREMYRNPRLVIAAQPTRGVDIGSIESIHAELMSVRKSGGGVLLVSSELDEILALSDRVIVLFGGKIAGELDRSQLKAMDIERTLGAWMGGQAPSTAKPTIRLNDRALE